MTLDDFKPNVDREHKALPEELQLAGGAPAINLFLADQPVITHEEHEAASDKLRRLAASRPQEFAALAGLPLEEARDIAINLLAEVDEEESETEPA